MTIEEYTEKNPNFEVENEWVLDFVERDNERELQENIEYILKHSPDFEALAAVCRSYYGDTIITVFS